MISLRIRLDEFFSFSDDDWLTPEDVALKWGHDIGTCRRALEGMARDGIVKRIMVKSTKQNRQIVAYTRAEVMA